MARPVVPSDTTRRLCLDISSRCVGFAVFDGVALVEYGKCRLPGEGHGERMTCYRNWLGPLLERVNPDEVVVERPYAGRERRNAYGVLRMYLGITLQVIYQVRDLELQDEDLVPPRTVKKLLKLPQLKAYDARKRQMVTYINELYNLKLAYRASDPTKRVSDDDIADAVALGHARLIQLGLRPER